MNISRSLIANSGTRYDRAQTAAQGTSTPQQGAPLSARDFTDRLKYAKEGDPGPGEGPGLNSKGAKKVRELGTQLESHLDAFNGSLKGAPLETADDLLANVQQTTVARLKLADRQDEIDSTMRTVVSAGLSLGVAVAAGFALGPMAVAGLGLVAGTFALGVGAGVAGIATGALAIVAKDRAIKKNADAQKALPGPNFRDHFSTGHAAGEAIIWETNRDATNSYLYETKRWAEFLQAPTTLAQF